MSEIFIARPGSLNPKDILALRKAGIVVVEANHEDVKFIRSTVEVSGGDMLKAALKALSSYAGTTNTGYATAAAMQREEFVKSLTALCEAQK